MKYLKKFNESTSYYNLHGDDDYEITKVTRDNGHRYQYCNGVLYELSLNGNDEVVDIGLIEHTEENMFYEDQIERYVEYIQDGGILESFPVTEMKVCESLEDMLEYLDDSDNFDETYDLLKDHHEKLWNIFMGPSLWDISSDPEKYGFAECGTPLSLKTLYSVEDLEEHYTEEDNEENYDEDILFGLQYIMEYFDDLKTYSLEDMNHRFSAIKKLGKSSVIVEVI